MADPGPSASGPGSPAESRDSSPPAGAFESSGAVSNRKTASRVSFSDSDAVIPPGKDAAPSPSRSEAAPPAAPAAAATEAPPSPTEIADWTCQRPQCQLPLDATASVPVTAPAAEAEDEEAAEDSKERPLTSSWTSKCPRCGSWREGEALRLLTWNVWFDTQVRFTARMAAIGREIELVRPHVICFQEVIQDALTLFSRQRWFEHYQLQLGDKARKNRYFVAIFVRVDLPTASTTAVGFRGSSMGRELLTVTLEPVPGLLPAGLAVGTVHLESPVGPRTGLQRVKQLKASMEHLSGLAMPRVLAGDFNWIEDDGELVLPPGWVDVWRALRGSEDGLTYDMELVKMGRMSSTVYRTRLDRVVCSGGPADAAGGCHPSSIDMRGTKPIPGLTYDSPYHFSFLSEPAFGLPVFPSDHFALLTCFSPALAVAGALGGDAASAGPTSE